MRGECKITPKPYIETVADFAAAMPDGAFDFIAFETCLMAGVEVADELRNRTTYIWQSCFEKLNESYSLHSLKPSCEVRHIKQY